MTIIREVWDFREDGSIDLWSSVVLGVRRGGGEGGCVSLGDGLSSGLQVVRKPLVSGAFIHEHYEVWGSTEAYQLRQGRCLAGGKSFIRVSTVLPTKCSHLLFIFRSIFFFKCNGSLRCPATQTKIVIFSY